MKLFNSRFINTTGLLITILSPVITVANDSWSEFVPPSSKHKFQDAVNYSKWQKTAWRSGSNFEPQNSQQHEIVSSNIIDAKEYAFTRPQRKSVNPWRVNRSWSTQSYKFGVMTRPWGNVPAQFQIKAATQPVYRKHAVNNQFIPSHVYHPFANRRALYQSSSLLPVGGYSALYSNPAYMNQLPFYMFPNRYGVPYRW